MNGNQFSVEMIDEAVKGIEDSGTSGTCPAHPPLAFAMKVLLLGERARQKEYENAWKKKMEVVGISVATSGVVLALVEMVLRR